MGIKALDVGDEIKILRKGDKKEIFPGFRRFLLPCFAGEC